MKKTKMMNQLLKTIQNPQLLYLGYELHRAKLNPYT
jgi:hypothetical protein